MLEDEFGINIEKVSDLNNRLSSYIDSESKIEYELEKIEDLGKKGYKSINGNRLNNNNKLIVEMTHSKRKNLTSYKNYTEKCITKYEANKEDVETLTII